MFTVEIYSPLSLNGTSLYSKNAVDVGSRFTVGQSVLARAVKSRSLLMVPL